jgi:RecB family endonuclease NucS
MAASNPVGITKKSTLAALSENREIERFARPKPDNVRRVIGQIISGLSVDEDGEAEPIEYSPPGKRSKELSRDGELTTPAWMRSDRALMETPHGDIE